MLYLLPFLFACQGTDDERLEDTSNLPPVADAPATLPAVDDAPTLVATSRTSPVAALPFTIPSGSARVRDCYGRRNRDEGAMGRGGGGVGYGGTASRAAPAAPGAQTAPPSKSSASASPRRKSEADASALYAPPAAEPASAAMDMAFAEEAEAAPMPAPEESKAVPERPDLDDAPVAQRERPPAGPALEWGGTIYLSNDDSMSLASAQRLLWSVQNGARFGVEEVRPHELLNYFGFDTEPVGSGALFSVHSSALRTADDELTLALAVRGANPPRQPLDLTVLVDRSGSMSAEGRMEYVKRGLSVMTESLRPGDRVDLVLFDDRVCTPLEDYVVGRDSPAILEQAIADMQPRGSTDLDLGLEEAYRVALGRNGEAGMDERNRRMLVVTDAFLNTGDVDPDTVSEVAKHYEENGIRLTGIGVGREFNDTMLDKLTEKGKGAYVYLGSEAVVDRVFGLGFESLTRTIAHDVRFALDLPDSLAMQRFYGEESSRDPEAVQPIHYYAGTTQLFLQDVKVDPARYRPKDKVGFVVTWKDARTGAPREQRFEATLGQMLAQDRHNVAKSRALMAWSDMLLAQAMGGDPCGDSLQVYLRRAAGLGSDAEMAYVNGLVKKQCGVEVPDRPVLLSTNVAYRVKLDTDIPIAEVGLQCPDGAHTASLGRGETVATFQVPPGTCQLLLQGNVPMRADVQVPVTGGDLRCIVRGGRLNCS